MRYRVFQRGWRGAGREMGVQPHVPHSTLLSSAHLWGHPYVQGPQDASRGEISERGTMGNAPEPVRVAGAQGPGEPSFPAP